MAVWGKGRSFTVPLLQLKGTHLTGNSLGITFF